MAKAATAKATNPRWAIGLASALAGLLVAIYGHTGDRIYSLVWFYVAMLGFALGIFGVAYIGYDRAIRPELERRKARGLPPPPPFRERARSLLEEVPPLPALGQPVQDAPAPKGRIERVRMSCPSCRHAFTAEGVRPLQVACPRCGLEGELP